MKPFDLLNTPLAGSHLIEASAGTGKTYTIEGIFVRLVLENKIPPSSILVVTFTQSATDELKERIYRKLVGMRRAFAGQPSDDDFIARLSASYPEPERGSQLIEAAIVEFDRAAIFTIHGFCQRILFENAVETGKLFDTELIEDQSPITRLIARDFWRTHLYAAEPEVIAYVSQRLSGPEALAGLVQSWADDRVRVLPAFDSEPQINSLGVFRRAALAVKARWPEDRAAVQSVFFDPALSGNVFGGLKPGPGAGGISQRAQRVAKLMASMDELHLAGFVIPPLFNDFSKFTSEKIERSTRKGQKVPRHPFLRVCDDLAGAANVLTGELDTYLAWLKSRALETSRTELYRRKKLLNVQYFDDLLVQVKEALEGPGRKALVNAVRRRYQAALVDEFQDTDRIQFDIFSRLFDCNDTPLFLIGDPKQAIYGFRGADIFTYMKAAQKNPQRHTLLENWRSSPGLIAAVNLIFSEAPVPFVYADIGFKPGSSAAETISGTGMPMTLWYLDAGKHGENGKPVPKNIAEPLIVKALATEISGLLTASDSATTAGDIAVLVRTNRQARMVKQGLTRSGIAAVLHSTGNIFDAPEAGELEALLNCIAHPADTGRVRRALVTRLWGRRANDLLALDADPEAWQELLQRILDYHQIWLDRGFMRMFRQLLVREDVAVRLMGLPEGERRLTNLLHLGEILHRSATDLKLNIPALANWLAEQRNPDTPRLDAHQLRMESDADAVRIVTIHKSKGLEYPVVFCPFCWEESGVRGSQLKFHDPRYGYRPTLHLNAKPEDDCHKWAQNEQLAENLRLLYVALTRAKSKCYLVWGRIRGADTSALAYLLHGRIRIGRDMKNTDAVALLSRAMAERSDADNLADLNRLAGRCPECLTIKSLPAAEPVSLPAGGVAQQPISRHFCGSIDRTDEIISYSTLAARRAGDADLPDHDDMLRRWQPGIPVGAAESLPGVTDKQPAIFAFARGPRAGIFFHDLLEQMDYAAAARESRAALVGEKLAEHGFESDWQDSVTDLLQQVLEVTLFDQSPEFRLSRLKPEDRLHELEFYFPLGRLTPQRLVALLEPYFKLPLGSGELNRIKELTFRPACGFMKGFVDMVFVYQGRYYLVDWKSNYLGDSREDYHRQRLQAVMDEHLYGLQSLIYTLALDQYLRLRLPGYRYEKNFGGAYYFFLRGIRIDWGAEYGIHTSRLGPAALEEIRSALIPASSGNRKLNEGRG